MPPWKPEQLNTNHTLHQGLRAVFHVVAAVWVGVHGVTAFDLWVLAATYVLGILSITGGYHRYFSHRAFKTGRWTQFVLGFFGCCQLQGGPLAWSAVHRHHHRASDQPEDLHTPRQGLVHAHIGWLSDPHTYDVAFRPLRDFEPYPELRWLDRYSVVPVALSLLGLWLLGATLTAIDPLTHATPWGMVMWGGVIRIVVVWHVTWSVNSLCHRFGEAPHDTGDDSKNNLLCGLLAMGEGWHNNHHQYPSVARSGMSWRQPDATYRCIQLAETMRLVWDVRRFEREG